MESILIVGLGSLGTHIAKNLNDLKCDVMAIDRDEDRVNAVLPFVTDAQIGDSTSETFMRSLGVDDYDACLVTIGSNFQTSLETTALLKELGAKIVISRAMNDVQEKFLLRNGADEVVYPEKQTAVRIATRLSSDSILDFIQLDRDYAIYEMRVPKDWLGKTVIQLDIRKKYGINIISVKHGSAVSVPSADTLFREGDTVFVLGAEKEIHKAFKI